MRRLRLLLACAAVAVSSVFVTASPAMAYCQPDNGVSGACECDTETANKITRKLFGEDWFYCLH